MEGIFNLDVLSAMMRIATPVMLAALGGLMCHKAGLVNIAMEGMMLLGSFGAIVFVQIFAGNVLMGYLGAVLFSTLIALLLAVVVLKFNANQIIASIAINLLAAGVTAFLLHAAFGTKGSLTPDVINKIPPVNIPFLENIPVINELFNNQYPLVYVTIIMAVVLTLLLYKTPYGLNLRSVGESESAAQTAGLNVKRIQLGAFIWSGVLCGLAGAYLSTSMVSEFTENMVQGRGFTAFTAIAFADGNPVVSSLVALLFGFAEALGIRIELAGVGLSSQIIQMFPYILALIVLTISAFVRARRRKVGIAKIVKIKEKKVKPAKTR